MMDGKEETCGVKLRMPCSFSFFDKERLISLIEIYPVHYPGCHLLSLQPSNLDSSLSNPNLILSGSKIQRVAEATITSRKHMFFPASECQGPVQYVKDSLPIRNVKNFLASKEEY